VTARLLYPARDDTAPAAGAPRLRGRDDEGLRPGGRLRRRSRDVVPYWGAAAVPAAAPAQREHVSPA